MSNTSNHYKLVKRTKFGCVYAAASLFAVIYSDGIAATFDTLSAALSTIGG